MTPAAVRVPWRRPLSGRDPAEEIVAPQAGDWSAAAVGRDRG